MPPEKTDASYLWDILAAAKAARKFITGLTFDEYVADDLVRSAVERQIGIVGEAACHISDSFKATHPEVPWSRIIAQRHVLAHEYADIQHDLIWKVATIHLPILIRQLEPLVPPPPPKICT